MPKDKLFIDTSVFREFPIFGFVFYGLGILFMETWQELKVTVKREGEELVSNLLIELGAQGVAIEDSMDYVGMLTASARFSQRLSSKKKS